MVNINQNTKMNQHSLSHSLKMLTKEPSTTKPLDDTPVKKTAQVLSDEALLIQTAKKGLDSLDLHQVKAQSPTWND